MENIAMGDYTVVVSGTGSHHNGMPGDADRLAQRFVEDLVEAQQNVRVAIITYGGLGVLDTISPERERYARQLEAAYHRDPSKFPYESIAEKLAEYDANTYERERALTRVNLMPMNRAKAHHESVVERGETVSWRYSPGRVRERSVDGGETWELAPEPDDVVEAIKSVGVTHLRPDENSDVEALVSVKRLLTRLGFEVEDTVEIIHETKFVAEHAETRINLNGRDVYVPNQPLTYEDVVKLTGEVEPSVTYRAPRGRTGKMASGMLTPGQSVEVEEGLIVSAVNTGNA